MQRITKWSARQIATALTEKLSKAVTDAQENYRKAATEIYEATIPVSVLKAMKEHPNWVQKQNYIYLVKWGFGGSSRRSDQITAFREVPANCKMGAVLNLSRPDANRLKNLKRDLEAKKEEKQKLWNQTCETLYALRTYERIRKEWPEAVKHFPTFAAVTTTKKVKTIGVVDLRKKLSK